jgi:hypothetical protein
MGRSFGFDLLHRLAAGHLYAFLVYTVICTACYLGKGSHSGFQSFL